MPNHCENDLYIKGSKKNLDKFKQYITIDKDSEEQDSKYYFDFNKFIPYPKEYKDADDLANKIREEAGNISGLGFKLWCIKNGYKDIDVDSPWQVPDGYNNGGYNWCIANRGTKWNSYSTHISTDSDTRLTINFDTAWSPPEPVIIKASEMFPELTFTLKYYECGACYKGVLQCKGGEILEQWSGEYNGNRGG